MRSPPSALERFVRSSGGILLLLLIMSANLIPTGSPFGIPIRPILFLGSVGAVLWLITASRQGGVGAAELAYGAALLAFVAFFTLLGLGLGHYPPDFVLADARTLLITLSMPFVAWVLVGYGSVRPSAIMYAFVGSSFVYALFKNLFFLFLLLMPELVVPLVIFFSNNEDLNFKFGFVAEGVTRIQSGLDFLLLIALVFVLFDRTLSTTWRVKARPVVIAVLSMGIFITFSRLLNLFLLLIWGYWFVRNFSVPRLLALLGGLLAVVFWFGDTLVEGIEARLETGRTGDLTRVPQLEALVDLWERRPFLGNGFGAFMPREIRDNMAPYNYELQLHSLASKVGVLGMLAFAGLLAAALVVAGRGLPRAARSWMLVGFAALFGAALTNPYMFSAAASSAYIALLIGFRISMPAGEEGWAASRSHEGQDDG